MAGAPLSMMQFRLGSGVWAWLSPGEPVADSVGVGLPGVAEEGQGLSGPVPVPGVPGVPLSVPQPLSAYRSTAVATTSVPCAERVMRPFPPGRRQYVEYLLNASPTQVAKYGDRISVGAVLLSTLLFTPLTQPL